MKQFIGIAYHKDLLAGNFEIKIGKFGEKPKDVVPVDLFWEEANLMIRDYPSKNTVTAEQKYTAKRCMVTEH